MATQKYRSRSDQTVAENEGTSRPVHPARPELPVKAGRENKTPAPTARRDYSMNEKQPTRGYGNDHDATPSSILPGETVSAPFGAQAPKDAVLEGLQRGGLKGLDQQDDWQTRDLSDPHDNKFKASPTHPGMKSANIGGAPSGQVPAKCGAPVTGPVRQPPANPAPYPKGGLKS